MHDINTDEPFTRQEYEELKSWLESKYLCNVTELMAKVHKRLLWVAEGYLGLMGPDGLGAGWAEDDD